MYFFELSPSPNSERTFDNKVDFFSRFSSQIQSNLIDVNFDHGSDFPKKNLFKKVIGLKYNFGFQNIFYLFCVHLNYIMVKKKPLTINRYYTFLFFKVYKHHLTWLTPGKCLPQQHNSSRHFLYSPLPDTSSSKAVVLLFGNKSREINIW